jgi:hypothetical protein
MRVALEEWLAVMPEFEVIDPLSIEWTGGTVRGPETVPFRILPSRVAFNTSVDDAGRAGLRCTGGRS